jgi:hypothetical protein
MLHSVTTCSCRGSGEKGAPTTESLPAVDPVFMHLPSTFQRLPLQACVSDCRQRALPVHVLAISSLWNFYFGQRECLSRLCVSYSHALNPVNCRSRSNTALYHDPAVVSREMTQMGMQSHGVQGLWKNITDNWVVHSDIKTKEHPKSPIIIT